MKLRTFSKSAQTLVSWGLCVILTLILDPVEAQDSSEISLLANWTHDTIPLNYRDAKFSEVWGFEKDGREYGVIGSTVGTHIIEITCDDALLETDYVPGTLQGYNVNHRDFAVYQNYLYAVAEQQPAALQIIDLSYLPDSVHLVYESAELFSNAHNFVVDAFTGKGYACGPNGDALHIYDLTTDPAKPELLSVFTAVNYVHDCYVRRDTAYLNCASQGLLIVDFANPLEPLILGNLAEYPDQGYNHSGWINSDASLYVMADETPGMALKMCDISDLSNIEVLDTFDSGGPETLYPHNPIIRDQYIYVSYYAEGLEVFDYTDPNDVQRVAWFDTADVEDTADSVHYGAWGVYPLLPSGRILVSDRQKGLLLFRHDNRVVLESDDSMQASLLSANPGDGLVILNHNIQKEGIAEFEVFGPNGTLIDFTSIVHQQGCAGPVRIDLRNQAQGVYLIVIYREGEKETLKYVKGE